MKMSANCNFQSARHLQKKICQREFCTDFVLVLLKFNWIEDAQVQFEPHLQSGQLQYCDSIYALGYSDLIRLAIQFTYR